MLSDVSQPFNTTIHERCRFRDDAHLLPAQTRLLRPCQLSRQWQFLPQVLSSGSCVLRCLEAAKMNDCPWRRA